VSAARIFQITLLLVLWYFLAGLVFSRWLGVWPEDFERQGYFLTAAAMPWALVTLDFQQQANSVLGAAVRDALFLLLLGLGIAINVAIANVLLVRLLSALALQRAVRRNVAGARRRLAARRSATPR
jgi:hypothetical protein